MTPSTSLHKKPDSSLDATVDSLLRHPNLRQVIREELYLLLQDIRAESSRILRAAFPDMYEDGVEDSLQGNHARRYVLRQDVGLEHFPEGWLGSSYDQHPTMHINNVTQSEQPKAAIPPSEITGLQSVAADRRVG